MFKSRVLSLAATLFAAALLPSLAKADTLTYNITYSGTGYQGVASTATGTGSVTFTFSSLAASGIADITDFSFTDTIKAPGNKTSVFQYAKTDLVGPGETFSGTLANPSLATFSFSTKPVLGSDGTFGTVNFSLAYPAVNPGTGTTAGANLADDTTGATTLTLAPPVSSAGGAAPEPSSLALLGTGLATAALFARRRFATIA